MPSLLTSHLLSLLHRRVTTVEPPAARSADAWERLVWVCHGSVYASLALASVVALREAGGVAGALLLTLAVAAFAAWYGSGVVRGLLSHPSLLHRFAFMLVGLVLLASLVALAPVYVVVGLVLTWHVTLALPMRWAATLLAAFAAWVALRGIVAEESAAGWLLGVVAPLVGAIVVSLFFSAIANQSRERRRLIDELESTRGELAAAEREAGVLQERQRLAGEIHDTLAQGFASIAMHLEAAEEPLDSEPERARPHIRQARDAARENLAEARRLVWALRPEALEHATLQDALVRVASRWSDDTSIAATVNTVGEPRKQPPEVEITLLRAAQEALTNVSKHARASNVVLTLSYIDEVTVLDVHDDGVGFDPDSAVGSGAADLEGGFGLAAMRERVERLGGRLVVESAPGEGSTLVVELASSSRAPS
jgi:signal transduction histidine kinase